MGIPKLAIIQCRMGSTRLPGKMLLPIGSETLIERVHRLTCEAFGKQNTVVAYPDTPDNAPLVTELDRIGAQKFGWDGPEDDVLGRFYYCAHTYRWHPSTVVIRITPDDPWKDPEMMRRVASGERLPVEFGGEAFTLAMLDEEVVRTGHHVSYYRFNPNASNHVFSCMNGSAVVLHQREHMTDALFAVAPPKAPPGVWEINTQADYDAVCQKIIDDRREFCGRLMDGLAAARQSMEPPPVTATLTYTHPPHGTDGRTGDLSDPQMGELHDIPESPFDGGPWRPC